MANLVDLDIDDTGYIQLPVGTTNQRPSNPENGMIRWNTTINLPEVFINGQWKELYLNRN